MCTRHKSPQYPVFATAPHAARAVTARTEPAALWCNTMRTTSSPSDDINGRTVSGEGGVGGEGSGETKRERMGEGEGQPEREREKQLTMTHR